MKAKVYKSTGAWYKLYTEKGFWVDARLKGALRLEGIKSTNPVAVGDEVAIVQEEGDWMINRIYDRDNYIIRKSPAKKMHSHILAANIDQAFLLITLSKPRTSTGFIDRFLLTAEAFHIPTTLVFNKQDVLTEKDKKKQEAMAAIYTDLGYSCLYVSSLSPESLDEVREQLKDKTTLFAGHSGVGKSTFANALDDSLNLKTGEVSKKHEKGKHTTTFAEMFLLNFGGNIIDIPGIKEFGVFNFEKAEVGHYFVEINKLSSACKFNNCIHINEPQCAVLEALENGEIHTERYKNYLNILADIEDEKEW